MGISDREAVPRARTRRAWAAETARLSANAERSLADEAGGPMAQLLLPIPQDGGADDGDEADDPLRRLKADISAARGQGTCLVETTAGGYGEGPSAAPRRDWQASRFGTACRRTSMVADLEGRLRARARRVRLFSPALFDD